MPARFTATVLLYTFGLQATVFAQGPLPRAAAEIRPSVPLPPALPTPAATWATPAPSTTASDHAVFGPEDFPRTAMDGRRTTFERRFRIPAYVLAPYVLSVTNGDPSGTGHERARGGVSGRVTIDGRAAAEIDEERASVQTVLSLQPGAHQMAVTLNGPAGHVAITVSGRVFLPTLAEPRQAHTATVLADGGILVAGGRGASAILAGASVTDPTTLASGTLSALLVAPRASHAATLLPDRSVLLAGGEDGSALAGAELFGGSPAAFVPIAGALGAARSGHTTTLLMDGRVLVLGGADGSTFPEGAVFDPRRDPFSAAVYDPATGVFAAMTGGLLVPRRDHTATLLPSGRVLVIGGRSQSGELASAEMFDPATGHSTLLPATLATPRAEHTATLLADGTVLVAGGRRAGAILDGLERYDPARGAFAAVAVPLGTPRAGHSAALLPSGEVWIAGGEGPAGVLASTELVGPPSADAVAPTVVATQPTDGATDVDLRTLATVRFSEPVDPPTVTPATFSVTTGGQPVPGTVGIGEAGLYAFFVPSAPLQPGTTYVVHLGRACGGEDDEHHDGGDGDPHHGSDLDRRDDADRDECGDDDHGRVEGEDHGDDGEGDDCGPCPQILDAAGNPLAPSTFTFTTAFAPVITTLNPTHGLVGTVLTIIGRHFDAAGHNVVTVGGLRVPVASSSTTQVVVTVPSLPAGPARVTVQTPAGTAVSPLDFLVENPVPVLTQLVPSEALAGTADIALTLLGANFVPSSTAWIGATALVTHYVSATKMGALVPASSLSAEGTFPVTVTNPPPGGGTSNALPFVVRPSNQAPVVSAGADQTVVLRDNLLDNPGAEASPAASGIPGWIEVAGSWSPAPAGTGVFPPSFDGSTFFALASGSSGELRQDVDVSPLAASIAAGGQVLEFRGYVRASDETPAGTSRVIVEFRDAANQTVLDSFDSGPLTSVRYWAPVVSARLALPGTAIVRVRLLSGGGATSHGGYFDALSLRAIGATPFVTAALHGAASDDGRPVGVLQANWSLVSGPGPAAFADPASPATRATFTVPGPYVLRLAATDTQLTSTADTTVTVVQGNRAPDVTAGPDQTITLPSDSAALAGTATDDGLPTGSTLTTQWSVVNGPGSVLFADPASTTTTATFSGTGGYTLRLTATDGQATTSDDVIVTVTPPNQPPAVDAGAAQTAASPATGATLAGAVTDDGLPVGAALTSRWEQAGGPGVATFADPAAPRTQVTFSAPGTYTLRLTASDSQLSASSVVTVEVLGANRPPSVNAGPNQGLTLPVDSAMLAGTATDDGLPAGSRLTVAWSVVDGPGAVTFGSADQPVTTARFATVGNYMLRLTASDSALTASSDVLVTVNPAGPANQPPVVSAGPGQAITLPVSAVTLPGTATDDGLPAGGTLSVGWKQIAGPAGVVLSSPAQPATAVTFRASGAYAFRLTATDSSLTSSADVVVTVNPTTNQPPAVDAGGDHAVTLPSTTTAFRTSRRWCGLPPASTAP